MYIKCGEKSKSQILHDCIGNKLILLVYATRTRCAQKTVKPNEELCLSVPIFSMISFISYLKPEIGTII